MPQLTIPEGVVPCSKELPHPSSGERLVQQALEELGLPFLREVSLADQRIKRKRFDFLFESDGRHFFVEYDGKQHFSFVKYLHHVEEIFRENQASDRLKQSIALSCGFYIIRIDFKVTSVDAIKELISSAMSRKEPCAVYSNPDIYSYLLD